MTEDINIISQKLNLYKEKKITIHVILKSRQFYNGIVTELGSDFFMIEDRKLGTMPVFFIEVYNIEPYKKEDMENEDYNQGGFYQP